MTEIDVALSDFAMAGECLVFAIVSARTRTDRGVQRAWLAALFLSLAVGALLGGTVHGFFAEETTAAHAVLWRATLVAIGATALCTWNFGAGLVFGQRGARVVAVLSTAGFVGYCGVVLWVSQKFHVAILDYLPAVTFLLVALGVRTFRSRLQGAGYAFVGIALTFVAAYVQQAGIALHPIGISHNTLYHLIQMVGLLLFFVGGRKMIRAA